MYIIFNNHLRTLWLYDFYNFKATNIFLVSLHMKQNMLFSHKSCFWNISFQNSSQTLLFFGHVKNLTLEIFTFFTPKGATNLFVDL